MPGAAFDRPRPKSKGRASRVPSTAAHERSDSGSLDKLQRDLGNHTLGSVLQRRPDPAKGKAGAKAKAAEAEAKGDAVLLAMHIEMVLSSPSYSVGDLAGLPDRDVAFITRLFAAIHDKPLDPSVRDYVTAAERENALVFVDTAMPWVLLELARDTSGAATAQKLQAGLRTVTYNITRNAVMARAQADAGLAAQLVSRPVAEARANAMEVLRKTSAISDKTLGAAGSMAVSTEALSSTGKDINKGVAALLKVLKTTDPSEYRKSVDEAREWCEEHHAGAVLGSVKALQVVAEMVELTAGTAVTVAKTLSEFGMKFFGVVGANVEMLEELEREGMLLSKGNQAALRFGRVAEFLEKAETVLSVVAIAGGAAKLITADSTFDRIDAGVSIGTGALSIAGKVTGEAAFGAAAAPVTLAWEFAKFVKYLGELGGGATEGFLFAGFYEEFHDIEAKGDAVARDTMALAMILDERDARFADRNLSDPARAGADAAADDEAYHLQKNLAVLDHRWRESQIPALARWYPSQSRAGVAWASLEGYPPEIIVANSAELLGALTTAYANAQEIVIEMAVDQGLISEGKAKSIREDMDKKAKKAKKESAKAKGGAD